MLIYLAEITAYDLAAPGVRTLYFSTGSKGYINGSNFYEPSMLQPALMNREIFSDGQVGGKSTSSYGELLLVNNDGHLDYMGDYVYGGRDIVIKAGEETAAYGSFVTVLKAKLDQCVMEWENVALRLRDRISDFDKPIQTALYGGTNALPNGVDGLSDLKDQQKPLIYGRVNNMTPVLVNTSKLIYQVNSGAVDNIVNAFDRGSYFGIGADYTSQSDMEANSPAAGYYRAWPAGGMFRLGSSPSGTVTVTVHEKQAPENCTAAAIAYRIATGPGGVSPSDTVAADFTALDALNAGSVGIVCQSGQSISDALDQILSSVGAWWGFDALGRFRIALLDAPTGTPVATLTSVEILNIQRSTLNVNDSSQPVYRVKIKSDVNWTVQEASSLAGVVDDERAAWLTKESREIMVQNTSTLTAYPLAQEVVYDSLLLGQGFALPEAGRRLALFGVVRHVLDLTVRVDSSLISVIDLGVLVSVQINRFGYNAGKLFRVIGIKTDYQNNQIDLRLWG